jgi:hypothetical protein
VGAMALIALAGTFMQYQRGGLAAVPAALQPALGMVVILALILFLRGYRNSFQITCAPDRIVWRDWFANQQLLVADIAGCTIRWWTSRSTTHFKLEFLLRNGTKWSTQGLFAYQYPRLVAELRRRYEFPVLYDPEHDGL